MTQTLKIMAAVDLSDYSAASVRYSVELAMKLDAELLLINVINQRDLEMVQRTMIGYDTFSFPNYILEQEQDREAKMKELFMAVSPGTVSCRYIVKNGTPYLELLAAIEAEKPNLMVVGTKGRSNLADMVVGSTARKMFRRSPIPLLTIPAGFNGLS
jgi:nucleotide-binding universal stress UspA family protein